MSSGWICDRCGKYFEEPFGKDNNKNCLTTGKTLDEHKFYDLCEKCMESFVQWINTKSHLGTECSFLVLDEAAYLSKDSLPYGWPVFEDGTPVKQGDEVLGYSDKGLVANRVCYDTNGWTVASGHGYAAHSIRGIFVRPTKEQMAEYYKKYPAEKKHRPNYVTTVGWTPIGYTTDVGLKITDDVNHPKHYDNGTVECIDWIEERLSPEEFKGYLLGNALKYSFRYEDKGKPVEDLRKAQWYLKKLEEQA